MASFAPPCASCLHLPLLGRGRLYVALRPRRWRGHADPEAIAESVRVATGVRPIIEKVERLQIFDPDRTLKAKRFKDLR